MNFSSVHAFPKVSTARKVCIVSVLVVSFFFRSLTLFFPILLICHRKAIENLANAMTFPFSARFFVDSSWIEENFTMQRIYFYIFHILD